MPIANSSVTRKRHRSTETPRPSMRYRTDCCPNVPGPRCRTATTQRCASTTPIWPNWPRRTTTTSQSRTGQPHDHSRREHPHSPARLPRDGVDDGSVAYRPVLRTCVPLHLQGVESTHLDRYLARLGLFRLCTGGFQPFCQGPVAHPETD